jgi:ADP-L-glycero-D-manno-heptose 6-epimerase
VERNDFFNWLDQNEKQVQFIFHLGARTDTTLFDKAIFDELNVRYSQRMWEACVKYGIPLVYASSAATYGDGEWGTAIWTIRSRRVKPLNPYGESKNEFDKWALKQQAKPFFWAGLKFFNVYGPNEYHKGRMASVVLPRLQPDQRLGRHEALPQPPRRLQGRRATARFRLREGSVPSVHVPDAAPKEQRPLQPGSGKARTFLDLVRATFKAMGRPENITFIDTPADIRDKYQYFTEARHGETHRYRLR